MFEILKVYCLKDIGNRFCMQKDDHCLVSCTAELFYNDNWHVKF